MGAFVIVFSLLALAFLCVAGSISRVDSRRGR
jgi:hypothetical protein